MSTEYEIGKNKPPTYSRWPKGQSGNPGGTVKGTVKISSALAKLLRTAPKEEYIPKNKGDVLALALYDSALKGDTWASREILDRTEGKVSQQLAITASQLPTNEIVERLVEAFQSVGIDELQSRKVLLMLSEGESD